MYRRGKRVWKMAAVMLMLLLGKTVSAQEWYDRIVEPTPQTSYAAGGSHVVLRTEDGTVRTKGDNTYLQRDTDSWSDIAAVAAGDTFSAGLKYDGTVVIAGQAEKKEDIERWSDVVVIAGEGNTLIALTADGSIKTNRYKEEFDPILQKGEEGNIRAVAVLEYPESPVVLMEDGRLCAWAEEYVELDLGWTDVEAITTGNSGYIFGITGDGHLRYERLYEGIYDLFWNLDAFEDIVQVYVSGKTCYGVRSDGTVMQAQNDPAYDAYEATSEVASLQNIAGIVGSGYFGHELTAVTTDGELLSVIYNFGEDELEDMKNLTAVYPGRGELFGGFYVIGIGQDQNVYLYGTDNSLEYLRYSQYNGESDYNQGIQFDSTGLVHSAGSLCEEIAFLDQNGVLWSQTDEHGYQKISGNNRQIACSKGLATGFIVELKTDNTVHMNFMYQPIEGLESPDQWTDIMQIASWRSRDRDAGVLGMKSDGTVESASVSGTLEEQVADWSNITGLYAGEYALGAIKADGTAVFLKDQSAYDFGQYNTADWTDLTQLALGIFHTAGLKSDGTVYATGRNNMGQCEVSDWKDIVYIAAWENATYGIQKDGTLLIAGEAGGK